MVKEDSSHHKAPLSSTLPFTFRANQKVKYSRCDLYLLGKGDSQKFLYLTRNALMSPFYLSFGSAWQWFKISHRFWIYEVTQTSWRDFYIKVFSQTKKPLWKFGNFWQQWQLRQPSCNFYTSTEFWAELNLTAPTKSQPWKVVADVTKHTPFIFSQGKAQAMPDFFSKHRPSSAEQIK